jgi:hypothetical protein
MSFLAKRLGAMAVLGAMILAGNGILLAGVARAGDSRERTVAVSLQGAKAVSDRALAGWVEKRIQEWQLTAAERRFDDIGWAKTFHEAEQLAKQHGRPIFLFTYDGQMAIGRC